MRPLKQLLTKTVQTALKIESIAMPSMVSILLVDDDEIRRINLEFRAKDSVTDVLSFPMLEMKDGKFLVQPGASDMEKGTLFLGDIVIAVPKALEQAQTFEHSAERELAFLTVHGLLHLLGYDHEKKDREETMTTKQEKILSEMGVSRQGEHSTADVPDEIKV